MIDAMNTYLVFIFLIYISTSQCQIIFFKEEVMSKLAIGSISALISSVMINAAIANCPATINDQDN